MVDEHRIKAILEEILDSGRSPEELCSTFPELLPEVQERLRRLRSFEQHLAAMFPSHGLGLSKNPHSDSELPNLPGYIVLSLLGRGGMGVVYKARHLKLNRTVAIKMLATGGYAAPPELARFAREAQAIAALRHVNIIQVFDVGDLDGRPYFTMEYLEGGSLSQKLAGVPQPGREAAAMVATLADAIQIAHEAGIVHRDLKPANILLTADGTPKISDFGLARSYTEAPDLTLGGTRLGTPSYMSPEQAIGRQDAIGPSTDIYSLGAVLYEMLTGRPPFKAESPAETERQVISEDPAPPSRLNAKVPRDLETICLKCLCKDPHRRYASASDLADDLRRFLNHEPIHARRIGLSARIARWIRRKPTAAALVATALAFVALAIGGGMRIVKQQAARRADMRAEVTTAVDQAASLRNGFHFQEAGVLLEQAQMRLQPAGPEDLRRKVEQARADLGLVENLDKARLQIVGSVERSHIEQQYQEILSSAGLGRPEEECDVVAERVRASTVRAEIVAGLDDWAGTTRDATRREWLLSVARTADPDPTRDRLRQPQLWQDGSELTRAVQEIRLDELSPQLLTALGRVLRANGGDAVPLLTAAQAQYPQDFWLNFELGWALHISRRDQESLAFDRAALALRPDAVPVYNSLALSLTALGRSDEAVDCLQRALNIDRNSARAHHNLGLALYAKNRTDEAICQYEESIRLDPEHSAMAHYNLGVALSVVGHLDEAIKHYEESIRLDPQASGLAHYALGLALRDKGQMDKAINHLQQAFDLSRGAYTLTHDSLFVLARDALLESLHEGACAAVQVQTGQGFPEPPPTEEERVRLRRQALDWLRAGLELATRLSEEGIPVDWSLATWQTDAALASVREPDALASLPDAEREQWQRLWKDVAAQIASDPLEQAQAHAARREWAEAANEYGRALSGTPIEDGERWFEYAAVLLLAGDRAGYTNACSHMVEQCGIAPNLRAYHVARACTLAPDAVADASLPGRLAESELSSESAKFWSLTEQGALQYRAGHFARAATLFEQSLAADSSPGRAVLNWLWLALARDRLGNAEEARSWYERASGWLDQFPDGIPSGAEREFGLHLHNWLEAHILRREAEAAIANRIGEGAARATTPTQ